MTERERLIELLNKKYDHFCDQCGVNKDSHYTENLADYLLANGVIVPPCKVGDKLYVAGEFTGQIVVLTVGCISITKNDTYYHCEGNITVYGKQQIGKTVFLTKEEAEQALKGNGG